ncbi:hypothetical protein ANO11243_023460 [Dothideomycetidae sp. 11243]|nr:hypothetical protein ANO11243_023460 [fungal sp. No.11243]
MEQRPEIRAMRSNGVKGLVQDEESLSEDLDTIPSKPKKRVSKTTTKGQTRNESDEDGETDGADNDVAEAAEDEEDDGSEDGETEEGAADMLEEYHKSIGGKPVAESKAKGGRGKRKSAASTASPAAAGRAGRPAKKAKSNGEGWTPPIGTWEDKVQSIQTICDDNERTNGKDKMTLHVFMQFNDGHRTKFPMELVRQKCPQKVGRIWQASKGHVSDKSQLLDYYEQHLWVEGRHVV